MKKILFLAAVATVCACGGRSNEVKELTIEEQVEAVLTQYFETKALDCSVVSVQCIDTLYEAMPKDDPVFLRYMKKHDDREKMRQIRRLSGHREFKDYTYVDSAIAYMRSYRGPIEALVYKCIVRSSSYEMKKDLEDALYLVDTTRTQVRVVDGNYLERLEQNMKDYEDLMRVL